MTLATRCPHCQTAFRLVPDQLRLAEGWVRCGRCDQIFPATEHLLGDGERPEISRAPEIIQPKPVVPATPTAPAPMEEPFPSDPALDGPTLYDPPIQEPALPERIPQAGSARHVYQWERGSVPSWRSGSALTSLGVIILLVLALAAQVLWWGREIWAPNHPRIHTRLSQMAQGIGWVWPAPRALDRLELESGELTRLGGQVHELRMVLVNRLSSPVALPAFELSLQDASGQTIIRRVLFGRDLGLLQTELSASERLPLQLGLDTGDQAIAGYTVELFYP
jgi:predicted Zn finger-like uncharacterized protein